MPMPGADEHEPIRGEPMKGGTCDHEDGVAASTSILDSRVNGLADFTEDAIMGGALITGPGEVVP